MVQCGLRCVEVSRADVADWDPVAQRVFVRGKFGHERWVPVPEEAAEALSAYLAAAGHSSGPLFRAIGSKGGNDGRLSPAWISRKMALIMHEAGVHDWGDGRSAHAMRHTFATDVSRRTSDLLVLRDLLGHASLATTQIYLGNASEDRLRSAVEGRRYTTNPAAAVVGPEAWTPTEAQPLPPVDPDPVRDAEELRRLLDEEVLDARTLSDGLLDVLFERIAPVLRIPEDEPPPEPVAFGGGELVKVDCYYSCKAVRAVPVSSLRVTRWPGEHGHWSFETACPECGSETSGRLEPAVAGELVQKGAVRALVPAVDPPEPTFA